MNNNQILCENNKNNSNSMFSAELIGKAGSMIISDFINKKRVVFLGKSNVPKRKNKGTFESFGGRYESEDISSLHTAVREMIEEFFNIKVNTSTVNKIAQGLINNKLIIKRFELYGMSYLINFKGLNYIFNELTNENINLSKYKFGDFFDYNEYFNDRIINDEPNDGLNEISNIEIIKLSDIKYKKIPLRWYTDKIIFEMLIKTK